MRPRPLLALALFAATAFCQTEAPKSGKAAPEAKTQEELDAYVAATGVKDMAEAETAAQEFAKKFPDSDLRASAYAGLMQRYQQADKTAKVIEMGRATLALDKDHLFALVLTANALAESTSETATDRETKFTEASGYAENAIKTMDANFVAGEMAPEQVAKIKAVLLATAHSALGLIAKKREDWAQSEAHYKESIAANLEVSNPATWMYLAIAQDHQKKYNDALDSINKSIAAADAQNNSAIAAAARTYKQRLTQLAVPTSKKKTTRKK